MFAIVHIVIFTPLGPPDWCVGGHLLKLFLFLLSYNNIAGCLWCMAGPATLWLLCWTSQKYSSCGGRTKARAPVLGEELIWISLAVFNHPDCCLDRLRSESNCHCGIIRFSCNLFFIIDEPLDYRVSKMSENNEKSLVQRAEGQIICKQKMLVELNRISLRLIVCWLNCNTSQVFQTGGYYHIAWKGYI